MDSLFPFLQGLAPLQHVGLSRRTADDRVLGNNPEKANIWLTFRVVDQNEAADAADATACADEESSGWAGG